eukprot:886927-Prorocentrum_minimum.AAC.1
MLSTAANIAGVPRKPAAGNPVSVPVPASVAEATAATTPSRARVVQCTENLFDPDEGEEMPPALRAEAKAEGAEQATGGGA